jgi:cell division protein FtsB
MNKKRRFSYWLAVLLAFGFVAVYTHFRDLPGRYQRHLEREQSVRKAQEELQALSVERDREKQRAEQLLNEDPLEIESAIRKYKQRVRPGETVFRIEEVPSTEEGADAPAP